MDNKIIKSHLVSNPTLAYEINIPSPERLELTEYEAGAYPAIFANLLNVSVSRAYPLYRVGRVLSFDIKPLDRPDPIIIYCNTGDLKPYYSVWRKVVIQTTWKNAFFGGLKEEYDSSIKHFIETSRLSTHEICFAILEMLKFKNTNILT